MKQQSIRRRVFRLALYCLSSGFLFGCGSDDEPAGWQWNLPAGFPEPVVPEDNPMSEEKAELGRHLFYDTRLSGNETQSCASCHQPALAFTDGRARGLGSTGELHPRGAMSVVNTGYATTLTWANPNMESFEIQARSPLFGDFPVELGIVDVEEMLARLRADASYQEMFPAAFPDEADPFTEANVLKALGTFQRTLISGNAPMDKHTFQGDSSEVSEAALRGADLFFTERLECFHCHGGFNFSDQITHTGTVGDSKPFHNNALYNIDGNGAYPPDNIGLMEFTGVPTHMGRFKAPSLRNIELTAPYMHDGSIASLEEVLDHYSRGGRLIRSGPFAGDGSLSPIKSGFISGFSLTEQERSDVLEFFQSLTDWEFICDPRIQDPFGRFPIHERCLQ